MRAKKTLRVSVPSGVEDGNVLRVRGAGEAVKGGESGDLHVVLHVLEDKRFAREGSTIYSQARIGFTQAALGDTIEVETVDGSAKLDIPAGTQSGAEIRLRGKGVPTRSGHGDHVVVVSVVTPKKLSRDQRELLERLDLSEK
jgi:molecular chaperone DnaJ